MQTRGPAAQDDDAVAAAAAAGPFAAVLGAALQFEAWPVRLFEVLDRLTARSDDGVRTPHATLVVLFVWPRSRNPSLP